MKDDGDNTGPQAGERASGHSDEQIVERVRSGDLEAFELLLRRYNQRLYRVARSVLRENAEAEEVVQEAWIRAFDHLDQFAGRGSFATWLTHIALYEAWARARRGRRALMVPESEANESDYAVPAGDPEQAASDREVGRFLERAIEALPEKYRLVFVLREVEGLSTAEAAGSLRLSRVAVKTRLHRARALVRTALLGLCGPSIAGSYRFLGRRCERMRETVMCRIRARAGRNIVLLGR